MDQERRDTTDSGNEPKATSLPASGLSTRNFTPATSCTADDEPSAVSTPVDAPDPTVEQAIAEAFAQMEKDGVAFGELTGDEDEGSPHHSPPYPPPICANPAFSFPSFDISPTNLTPNHQQPRSPATTTTMGPTDSASPTADIDLEPSLFTDTSDVEGREN